MKPSPSTLSMREESHTIAKPPKPKPKVRIVHIFAPEIIKTDAANFRNLVQKLTGKPAKKIGDGKKKAMRATTVVDNDDDDDIDEARPSLPSTCKWMEESYLTGFGEVDGFFQGLTDHYPLPPMSTSSSHMDFIGDAHVIS